MLKNLIPRIFYNTIEDGLEFFVASLGFKVVHQDEKMAVIERDGAKAYIVAYPEGAAMERPEFGIDTDDIDAIYDELSARSPQLLHPNSKCITRKPWGSREFAMLDKTTVCVIFRQWDETK